MVNLIFDQLKRRLTTADRFTVVIWPNTVTPNVVITSIFWGSRYTLLSDLNAGPIKATYMWVFLYRQNKSFCKTVLYVCYIVSLYSAYGRPIISLF